MTPPFQRLLDDHADTVLRFLAGSVGPVDADDCFQETVIAALRAYPRLRHADNLRGWLLTIAHRKALDHHRARARRAVPVEDLEPGGRGAAEPRVTTACGRPSTTSAQAARRRPAALRRRPLAPRDRRGARLVRGGGPPRARRRPRQAPQGMDPSMTQNSHIDEPRRPSASTSPPPSAARPSAPTPRASSTSPTPSSTRRSARSSPRRRRTGSSASPTRTSTAASTPILDHLAARVSPRILERRAGARPAAPRARRVLRRAAAAASTSRSTGR